jgi:formate-dependent nitrite reductase membrane component NrfD
LGQAKGRDLWQDPLLPAHMLIKGALAGASVLACLTFPFSVGAADTEWIQWAVGLSGAAHLAALLSFEVMPKPTAHAKQAARNLTRGAWAPYHWSGVVLSIVGIAAMLLTDLLLPGGIAVLIGLLASEHAHIQAGQSVPQT